MNKVQQFLKKQCNIFVPNRRIVRRGVMRRRTTGWSARNKQYIFFLFNDVLLWTTQNGDLQNVVMLQDCEVMESEAKNSPHRKFKVVSSGQKNKILLLECDSERQRNEWFEAIKSTVTMAKSIEPEDVPIIKNEDNGAEAKRAITNNIQSLMIDVQANGSSPHSRRQSSEFRLADLDNFATLGSPTEELNYDDRYEYSQNFPNQEFKDFEPVDDTISVSEYTVYEDSKVEPTIESLSPFSRKTGSIDFSNSRSDFKIQRTKTVDTEYDRLMKIAEGEKEKEDEDDMSDVSTSRNAQLKSQGHFHQQSKPNIIRSKAPLSEAKMPVATTRLVDISNITIRLNDCE